MRGACCECFQLLVPKFQLHESERVLQIVDVVGGGAILLAGVGEVSLSFTGHER